MEAKIATIHLRVCLVSTPGLLCDTTCALIATTPNVRLVALADGALTATQQIHAHHAELDLILVDANVPGSEVAAFLSWLDDQVISIRTVVARTATAGCRQALAFGADDAVLRDELATHLARCITEILLDDTELRSH